MSEPGENPLHSPENELLARIFKDILSCVPDETSNTTSVEDSTWIESPMPSDLHSLY